MAHQRARLPMLAGSVAIAVAIAASVAAWIAVRHQPVRHAPSPEVRAVPPPTVVPPGATFVIAAGGDVAGRSTAHRLTAQLLLNLHRTRALAALLVLGDLQYPTGRYTDFLSDYDEGWGHPALKAITRPVPGNHDYAQGLSDADGYFDYFNGRGQEHGPAGTRGQGYYSFDMGDWHFVALNTSDGCRRVPCARGAPMHQWLVRDLAANRRPCVLAYFHHPRFQTGAYHGAQPVVAPLWDALYDGGVDLALVGHEHNFQQLAPLDKAGNVDRARGVRSFVVGTGGATLYEAFDERSLPAATEARSSERFGILELTLGPGRYAWRYLSTREPGGHVATVGDDVCR